MKYIHRACTQLTPIQFDAMVEASKSDAPSIKYFCDLCIKPVTDILCNFQKFKKVQQELNKIKEEIDDKIENLENRVGKIDNLENRMRKVEDKITKGIGQVDVESPSFRDILKKDIQTTVNKKIEQKLDKFQEKEEKELIEEKKNNLVLFNVPESLSENLETRMRHDRTMFLTLYDVQEEDFNDEEVKVMYRIGGKEAKKPRPMLVKFLENEPKLKYLKQSGDLALTVDEKKSKSMRLMTEHRIKEKDEGTITKSERQKRQW